MTVKELINHLRKNYKQNDVVAAHIWSKYDILFQAEKDDVEISEDDAETILENIEHNLDSNYGINWDTVSDYVWNYKYDKEVKNER